MDALEPKIERRRVVIEQADAEFVALAELFGGPYEIECTPERGELLRSVLTKYRPALKAAWQNDTG